MKKHLLATAALAALMSLAGCTSDEVAEVNTSNGRIPIAFTTSQMSWGADTRATNYRPQEFNNYGFIVYAEKSNGEALFDDTGWIRITKDGSFYTNSDAGKYHWPEDGILTFYAMSQYITQSSGEYTTNYCIPKSVMVMNPCVAITKLTAPSPVVPLRFKRLFCDVYLSLKNSREDIFKISITEKMANKYSIDANIAYYQGALVHSYDNLKFTFQLDEDGELDITSEKVTDDTQNVKQHPIACDDMPTYITAEPFEMDLIQSGALAFPQTLSADKPYIFGTTSDTVADSFFAIENVHYYSASNDTEVWTGTLYFPLDGVTLVSNGRYCFSVDLAKGGYIEDPDNAGTYIKLFEKLPIMGFSTSLYDWDVEPEVEVSVN